MPLHPCPGDLTQRKAAREQGVGVGTTISCPLHHRGVPSSVCLSDSSGAIALGVYSRTISSSLFFSRNFSQASKVAQKLEDSPATLVVT